MEKMLDMENIKKGLAEIADMGMGRSILLVGGVALHAYGSTRLTADLDVVVAGPWSELPVEGSLHFGGYISRTPSGVPVDVIIRDDAFAALYEAALLAPARLPQIPIPVVSLEFAFAMKMAAGRPKDLADLDTILSLGVDRQKARQVAGRYLGAYALKDFDQIVREADWRKQDGSVRQTSS